MYFICYTAIKHDIKLLAPLKRKCGSDALNLIEMVDKKRADQLFLEMIKVEGYRIEDLVSQGRLRYMGRLGELMGGARPLLNHPDKQN